MAGQVRPTSPATGFCNCGPIACLKLWTVFCAQEVDMDSLMVGDYRNTVVDKCNVLIQNNKSQCSTNSELESVNKRKRIQPDSAIDITQPEVSVVVNDKHVRDAAWTVASGKRKLFQLKQAEMMMKRREQCLKHVTVGTLVSCKMDPRDFKSVLGLQAIVWDVSDSGAGGVHGLVMTENGKSPYWIPNERYSVPRVQYVAMPRGLNKVRRDIQRNIFDVGSCAKISIQKAYQLQHPGSTQDSKGCGCKGNKVHQLLWLCQGKKKMHSTMWL
ncbi:hypothetical protein IV203_001882 [Nitzschia inconspicua]|uniref:Uncharacterized protein n=1 Tax=Nitzschia inconspicua TaxID=303405 RepID=A0A9K3PU14_9STRA|nr:hypothetical protein IV203_001882 [Nitzschia inconspicua]